MALNSGIVFDSKTGRFLGRPIADRLWARVQRCATDLCWPWQGRCFGNGYGKIRHNGKRALTHRVAYEVTYGAIPSGLVVRHTCDRPVCCNPQHLIAGTQKENLADMDTKGRRRNGPSIGEKNGSAKLTATIVLEIRKSYIPRVVTRRILADRFGVSIPLIEKILAGKIWKMEEAGYELLGWAREERGK